MRWIDFGFFQFQPSEFAKLSLTLALARYFTDHASDRGYLLKESPESDLIRAIRSVNEGKSFFSPVVSRMLVEDYVRQLRAKDVEDSYELLSLREREVFQLIAEGKTNKEIAAELFISPRTVETHRANLCRKLQLEGAHKLLQFAIEHRSEL